MPEDLTTKEELKGLLQKVPLAANHTSYMECCLGVSVDDFWAQHIGDDATCN